MPLTESVVVLSIFKIAPTSCMKDEFEGVKPEVGKPVQKGLYSSSEAKDKGVGKRSRGN